MLPIGCMAVTHYILTATVLAVNSHCYHDGPPLEAGDAFILPHPHPGMTHYLQDKTEWSYYLVAGSNWNDVLDDGDGRGTALSGGREPRTGQRRSWARSVCASGPSSVDIGTSRWQCWHSPISWWFAPGLGQKAKKGAAQHRSLACNRSRSPPIGVSIGVASSGCSHTGAALVCLAAASSGTS